MAIHHKGPCSDGLLVVAHSRWFQDSQGDAPDPSLPLDDPTIAERFKGLSADRHMWPLEDARIDALCWDGGLLDCGLVPLFHLTYVEDYYRRALEHAPCDLLYCQPLASWDEAELRESEDLSFRGYDYGYYLGAENHFSAVHNDILYGRYDVLRSYAEHLNSDLLLPALELVQDVHHDRTELIHAHAALEHDESFIPIAIFVPRVG
jgi:hypothetical protein